MAARHKRRKDGGSIKEAGGNPYVLEEAKDTKDRKKGGKVLGKMHGGMSKMRLDRPGRKRGGRVGADKSPLSSAYTDASPNKEPREGTSSSHD